MFRKSRLPGFSIYGPVLLGLLLSTTMELIQLLEPTRDTSMADVITNIIGSGLGVMAGLLFEALASRNGSKKPAREALRAHYPGVVDRAALMLAFCWVAWLVFPLFPALGLYQLARKFAVFEHSQLLDPVPIVSAAAAWFAAGLLIPAAGIRVSRVWFPLTLLAIPAQFFIVDRQPMASFLLGAIVGVALVEVCQRRGIPAKAGATAFLAAIIVRGLSPFHFVAGLNPFNWIPFVPILTGDRQQLAGVLIEKVFYYGTAIWLVRSTGLSLVRSVALVAVVLALIEVAQTSLPGRTPEIMDPILAIFIGFALAMLSRPARHSPA